MVDIIIPTLRSNLELAAMLAELYEHTLNRVIVTGLQTSAARNRNFGLEESRADVVVMIDDDIEGFYDGWVDQLVAPLVDGVFMVSARLMKPDGTRAEMNGSKYLLDQDTEEVPHCPSACIAFRNDGTRFHENFRGSGFEDTWFCDCLRAKYPGWKLLINNRARLVHLNEMKNQRENFEWNSGLYERLRRGEE